MKRILLVALVLMITNFKFIKAQSLYDITNITTIDIIFTETFWDDTLDTYYATGLDQRLLATCTVNGVQYDSVGVKYKGNSTYNINNNKNPMNIKLDYVINQDYSGFNTLKLANGDKDPSFIREVLGYKIGRYYMDMPLSNYAKITINGNYHGMFSSSESINGAYQERYVHADNNNIRFKCNPNYGMGVSPSLEYLGTDSSLYFNGYELKSDYGWTELVSFTNSLLNNTSNLETFLDIDRAIWMAAYNNVLSNLDSYTGAFKQNYYMIKDDNNRFMPIIWDLNMCFGSFTKINLGPPTGPANIVDITDMDFFLRDNDSGFPLIKAILDDPTYRRMYVAHCKTMVEENLANNSYFTEAQTLQSLISNDVTNDPNAFYTSAEFLANLTTSQNNTFGVSQVLNGRLNYLQNLVEYNYTAPTISNITAPTNPVLNSSITITAQVITSNFVYVGYRNSNSDFFTKITMYDDGLNNDGAAGDGVFGASIVVGVGTTEYYIYAENTQAGIFSPVRAEHDYYSIVVAGDVVINELLASNSSIQADQDGEFDDWIELYNNTTSPIVLDGYYLSDESINLTKWTFPTGTIINGNDYLIIWADKDTLQAGLHTNFKLSNSGESLYLSDTSINLINETTFGAQTTDITWGRYPNGTGGFINMVPTYSATNSNSPVGVETVLQVKNSIKVYPNPANQIVNIVFDKNENNSLYIFNILGESIYSSSFVGDRHQIDVSNWSKGMYIIKTSKASKKLIIN